MFSSNEITSTICFLIPLGTFPAEARCHLRPISSISFGWVPFEVIEIYPSPSLADILLLPEIVLEFKTSILWKCVLLALFLAQGSCVSATSPWDPQAVVSQCKVLVTSISLTNILYLQQPFLTANGAIFQMSWHNCLQGRAVNCNRKITQLLKHAAASSHPPSPPPYTIVLKHSPRFIAF